MEWGKRIRQLVRLYVSLHQDGSSKAQAIEFPAIDFSKGRQLARYNQSLRFAAKYNMANGFEDEHWRLWIRRCPGFGEFSATEPGKDCLALRTAHQPVEGKSQKQAAIEIGALTESASGWNQ